MNRFSDDPPAGPDRDADASSPDPLLKQVRSTGRDMLSEVEKHASKIKESAAEKGEERLSRTGERVDSITSALLVASQEFDEQGEDRLANWVRNAASQVDRVSGYLHDQDAPGLLADVEERARAQPYSFLGGSFAAGLVLGRFLRSSTPQRSSSSEGPRSGDRPETAAVATAKEGLR